MAPSDKIGRSVFNSSNKLLSLAMTPSFHQLLNSAFTDVEILCLRMMQDNRRRGLLRHKLESRGERNTQLRFSREQVEHFTVILKLGNGRIAPGVALALILFHPQFFTGVLV